MDRGEYKNFKNKFWSWFDELPVKRKQEFWYYKEDAAETYFYFKFYEETKDELC